MQWGGPTVWQRGSSSPSLSSGPMTPPSEAESANLALAETSAVTEVTAARGNTAPTESTKEAAGDLVVAAATSAAAALAAPTTPAALPSPMTVIPRRGLSVLLRRTYKAGVGASCRFFGKGKV
ncbi:unnamed protein product, partial [Phaeothamnion confervicola]